MKRITISAAIFGAFVASQPVFADDLSSLKAEIAAQKQAAAVQQARLDALEKKLESAQALQSNDKAPTSVPAYTMDGLTYKSAEQTITLYGQIEATVSSVDNKDSAGNSLRGFQTPWFSGSRWGITGSRELNTGGLKAIYKLESEYVTATGEEDTAGVLFNRDAWAGLQSDDLGKLTFGRQNAIGRDFAGIYGDAYGAEKVSTNEGGFTNTNNFKQMVYYGGSATGTRVNNGIVWKKVFSNGLVAGASYAFGGGPSSPAGSGTAANPSEGTTTSFALGYNATKFLLAGFLTQAKVDGLTDQSFSFGGSYLAGPLRINAGYFHYTGEQGALGGRTDNAYTLSAKYVTSPSTDVELGYQVMKADNAALSKPTGGIVKNAFASVVGLTATGSGNRNTLYGSAFYHFNKFSDVYVAADYLTLDAGYGTVNGSNSQSEVAVGIRTKF